MGGFNLFLFVWIFFWTLATISTVIPLEEATLGEFSMFVPPAVMAFLLLYSMFAQKSFRFSETSLHIETRLFFARWELTLPRKSITHLLQVKDGGKGKNSFPSWGLKIKSASARDSLASHFLWLVRFGCDVRYRALLSKLPYEQSRWFGIMVAQWAGTKLDLCDR